MIEPIRIQAVTTLEPKQDCGCGCGCVEGLSGTAIQNCGCGCGCGGGLSAAGQQELVWVDLAQATEMRRQSAVKAR